VVRGGSSVVGRGLSLDVYVWLNMFRALPRTSSGAYNCISSLWFYRWNVAVAPLLVVVYYLMFMCGSTCFGHFLAHHQELTTALAASGFTGGAWR